MSLPRRKVRLRLAYGLLSAGFAVGALVYVIVPNPPRVVVKTVPNHAHGQPFFPRKILCFVLDDAGESLTALEPFLNFPGPMTISVLPFLPHSRDVALAAAARGKDVILHMPMEPQDGQNAGPGSLLITDDPETIRAKLDAAERDIPGIRGLNNHMGSAFTEREDLMTTVLDQTYRRGLYFLDSMTTEKSSVRSAGRRLGLDIKERDVFLDNEKNRDSILQALEEGKLIAAEKGRAVMIGHVWTAELAQILMEVYPNLLEQGYTLEDLSQLVRGDAPDADLGD